MTLLELFFKDSLDGESIAVEVLGKETSYTYSQIFNATMALVTAIESIKKELNKPQIRVGIYALNSVEWVIADLACLGTSSLEIPVPIGFSHSQCEHLLGEVDICFVDFSTINKSEISFLPHNKRIELDINILLQNFSQRFLTSIVNQKNRPKRLLDCADSEVLVKAIHTSGTTASPKGVLISERALEFQVIALKSFLQAGSNARYLNIVPFSLLLEQICGIYLTFAAGGTLILLPKDEMALTGGGTAATHYLKYIQQSKPTFLTIPPSVVNAIYTKTRSIASSSTNIIQHLFGTTQLPLIACGGGAVSIEVLTHLDSFGIRVFEGYGLSENTSVVSWNAPHLYKQGTVGKALDHVEIKIGFDGELLIKSPTLFSGYLNSDPGSCALLGDGFLATGDLVEIDEQGFLKIVGRKKNLFITTSGRNISAEWLESVLNMQDEIENCCVIGDAREFIIALIIPVRKEKNLDQRLLEMEIQKAIDRANLQFPDYARVKGFFTSSTEVINLETQLFTVTHRPIRNVISSHFENIIEAFYI